MDLAKARALTPWWTDVDFVSLDALAKKILANTADLLVCIVAESDMDPNAPKVYDGGPRALGLIQITPVRATAMGMSEAQRKKLWKMPVTQQLPWILKAFQSTPWVAQKKPLKNAEHVYMLNFAPARMDHIDEPDYVVYVDGDKWTPAKSNPNINRWPRDNKITVQEIKNYVEECAQKPVFEAALVRLRHALNDPTIKPNLEGTGPIPQLTTPKARGFAVAAVLGSLAALGAAGLAYFAMDHR